MGYKPFQVGQTVAWVGLLSGPSPMELCLAVNPFIVQTDNILPESIMRILAVVMSNMFHNSVLQKQGNFFKLLTKCTEDTLRGKQSFFYRHLDNSGLFTLKGILHPKVKFLSYHLLTFMQSQMYMTFFCRTQTFFFHKDFF